MAAVTAAYLLPGKWSSQMALISGMMYRDPHPSVQGLMQKSIESFLGGSPTAFPASRQGIQIADVIKKITKVFPEASFSSTHYNVFPDKGLSDQFYFVLCHFCMYCSVDYIP